MRRLEAVFCGSSVYLCGLAASLQQVEQLRIRMVDVLLDKAMPELKMLHPDVVIAEVVNNNSELVDSLLRDYPSMLIIVVHPKTDLLEIYFGKRCLKSSVDDLVQVVRACAQGKIP